MTNAVTDIDLNELYVAIENDIKAAFPQFRTVEFYREDRKELPKPACLLELTEMEVSVEDDPGTEQLCVLATFEASLVIDAIRTPQSQRQIRVIAAALAAWLRKRRWKKPGATPGTPGSVYPTGEALVIGAYQDDFRIMGGQRDQDLPQYDVWRVEWQQRIHLGHGIFTNETFPPPEVWVGQAPEIGTGNEDDYDKVWPQ